MMELKLKHFIPPKMSLSECTNANDELIRAPASSLSMDDDVPESDDEISALPEENMERSFNKCVTSLEKEISGENMLSVQLYSVLNVVQNDLYGTQQLIGNNS